MVLVACGVARQQARGCGHQVTHAALERHAPLDDGGPDMTDTPDASATSAMRSRKRSTTAGSGEPRC